MSANESFTSNKMINLLFFTFATFGVVIYLIVNFSIPTGELIEKGESWKMYVMIPLYYTFISNVVVMLASWQRMFAGYFLPRVDGLANLSTVGIALTFVVYGALLSHNIGENPPIKIISSVFVHGITPLITMFVYGGDIKKRQGKTLPLIKSSGLFLLFPIGWLLLGLTIYFAFGHARTDAFYGFIAILQNPGGETLLIWSGIFLAFLASSFGVIKLRNKALKLKN